MLLVAAILERALGRAWRVHVRRARRRERQHDRPPICAPRIGVDRKYRLDPRLFDASLRRPKAVADLSADAKCQAQLVGGLAELVRCFGR